MEFRTVTWLFDAVDLRPVERWLEQPSERPVAIEPRRGATRVDLYLDTEDRRFHRAGYSLRICRPGRRGFEAALDRLDAERNGHPAQHVFLERLDGADPRLLLVAEGPVGERVRAVIGQKRLLPLFEVRTRRRVYSLELHGSAAGELALEATAISTPAGGPPARLQRVEIDARESALAAVEPLVDGLRTACALRAAALSEYELGLLSSGLPPQEPMSFGTSHVDADPTMRELALSVLRRQFAIFLMREPGTRLGDDIEELHDMRVASRRLRAALSLYGDVLPASVVALRGELAWIGRTLGVVRDLDVQLEQLDESLQAAPDDERAALRALRPLLEDRRRAARETMLEAFDSRRYQSFVTRFGRTLRARHHAASGRPSLPARSIVPELIVDRFRRFRKGADRIGPASAPTAYHRLRIRVKRLRYTLEFVAELYPGQTEQLVKRLVAVQDVLGRHQDADVAVERLRRLAVEHGEELGPAAVFAMGEIAERHRQDMIGLRAQFPAAYARVRGKAWKSFRKLIDAAQPPAGADPPD